MTPPALFLLAAFSLATFDAWRHGAWLATGALVVCTFAVVYAIREREGRPGG